MAYNAQLQIGLPLLFCSYIAHSWTQAFSDLGVEHPSIWFDAVDVLWRARNEILHHQQNQYKQSLDKTNTTQLHWFLLNPDSLAQQDRYLLNYTVEDIPLMPA
jgi:hypothetical protein